LCNLSEARPRSLVRWREQSMSSMMMSKRLVVWMRSARRSVLVATRVSFSLQVEHVVPEVVRHGGDERGLARAQWAVQEVPALP
jgi:hypothetical protein